MESTCIAELNPLRSWQYAIATGTPLHHIGLLPPCGLFTSGVPVVVPAVEVDWSWVRVDLSNAKVCYFQPPVLNLTCSRHAPQIHFSKRTESPIEDQAAARKVYIFFSYLY